jgi:hypothetical protein
MEKKKLEDELTEDMRMIHQANAQFNALTIS